MLKNNIGYLKLLNINISYETLSTKQNNHYFAVLNHYFADLERPVHRGPCVPKLIVEHLFSFASNQRLACFILYLVNKQKFIMIKSINIYNQKNKGEKKK